MVSTGSRPAPFAVEENEKSLVFCPSRRTIGGYFFASRDQFDLCFVVDDVDGQLCAYFFTIDQVEQYDRVTQPHWIEELTRNSEHVDQVSLVRCSEVNLTLFSHKDSFELITCPQRIYENYPVRVHWCIDWTVRSEEMHAIGERLLTIVTDQLIKRGLSTDGNVDIGVDGERASLLSGRSGCHALVNETNSRMIELYFHLGFIPLNNIDDKQSNLVLVKQF